MLLVGLMADWLIHGDVSCLRRGDIYGTWACVDGSIFPHQAFFGYLEEYSFIVHIYIYTATYSIIDNNRRQIYARHFSQPLQGDIISAKMAGWGSRRSERISGRKDKDDDPNKRKPSGSSRSKPDSRSSRKNNKKDKDKNKRHHEASNSEYGSDHYSPTPLPQTPPAQHPPREGTSSPASFQYAQSPTQYYPQDQHAQHGQASSSQSWQADPNALGQAGAHYASYNQAGQSSGSIQPAQLASPMAGNPRNNPGRGERYDQQNAEHTRQAHAQRHQSARHSDQGHGHARSSHQPHHSQRAPNPYQTGAQTMHDPLHAQIQRIDAHMTSQTRVRVQPQRHEQRMLFTIFETHNQPQVYLGQLSARAAGFQEAHSSAAGTYYRSNWDAASPYRWQCPCCGRVLGSEQLCGQSHIPVQSSLVGRSSQHMPTMGEREQGSSQQPTYEPPGLHSEAHSGSFNASSTQSAVPHAPQKFRPGSLWSKFAASPLPS